VFYRIGGVFRCILQVGTEVRIGIFPVVNGLTADARGLAGVVLRAMDSKCLKENLLFHLRSGFLDGHGIRHRKRDFLRLVH